ncbi:glycosyl transferase [Chondrocystis sp. NIES-4102]|nr:glycosyl transferase [Chondrocystis sp. NIES-4102]
MKIIFVLPRLSLSGGNRVVAIYADKLQQRGHDVFLISQPMRPITIKEQIKSLLRNKKIALKEKPAPFFDILNVPHKVLERERPVTDADVPDADIVIATWWQTAEWVANLSNTKGAKAYFIQHHEIHDPLPRNRVEATYLLPLYKITIAKWLVNLMNIKYQDNHVSLVPNSVDTKQFFSSPRSKQSVPTVGMMYSLQKWKGVDISLEAFKLANSTIKDLRLLVLGQHKPLPELLLPSNSEFIYQPPQEQIKDIYSQCDAWLFGSRSEGFGLPILEAMACRTPVIATPAGAAPELLANGGGILVKPEDPEDMARAILHICNLSNQEWRFMSDAAYKTATSYTWDDATNLFEKALYTAIGRKTDDD